MTATPIAGGGVRQLFGIPVAALTLSQTIEVIELAISTREPLLIGVVNAAKIVNMRRDRELGAAVLASDVILADGFSVVLAARLLGRRLPERVTGIDLMYALLARASDRRYRVYCLGAGPAILDLAERAIKASYPHVQVVGRHHGYFAAEDEPSVADDVRRSAPDILFVGMTSPKKEQFLGRWGATLGVPVCHGVGGSFDVLAGKVKRAPARWQRLGLEWLYRVRQEPGRLWKRYLITNSWFIGLLVVELLRTAPHRMHRTMRSFRSGSAA